jgi:hypothetical protein
MKYIVVIVLYLLACGNSHQQSKNFKKIIPDTTNNWYAQLYDISFYSKKETITNQLNLYALEKGSDSFEVRLWKLAGSYNPQNLYIITSGANGWNIRHYTFYLRFGTWNSPIIDSQSLETLKFSLVAPIFDSANFDAMWTYKSQSEMTKGSSYGCMDDFAALIEMADKDRYKYSFYNCPDVNASKDTIFRRVAVLYQGLNDFFMHY